MRYAGGSSACAGPGNATRKGDMLGSNSVGRRGIWLAFPRDLFRYYMVAPSEFVVRMHWDPEGHWSESHHAQENRSVCLQRCGHRLGRC